MRLTLPISGTVALSLEPRNGRIKDCEPSVANACGHSGYAGAIGPSVGLGSTTFSGVVLPKPNEEEETVPAEASTVSPESSTLTMSEQLTQARLIGEDHVLRLLKISGFQRLFRLLCESGQGLARGNAI